MIDEGARGRGPTIGKTLRAAVVRFGARDVLRKLATNIGWLLGDKLLRLGLGVWVNALIARHLGPEDFGALNYAAAFVALFAPFAAVGLPDILIREFIRRPTEAARIMGAALAMRVCAGFVVMIVSWFAARAVAAGDHETALLVLVTAVGPLAQALDVVDNRYLSMNLVKPIILLRNATFLMLVAARITAIALDAGVMVFAALTSAELVVVGLLMWLKSRSDGHLPAASGLWAESRHLFASSWPVMLRLAAIAVYMRVDQLLIGHFAGQREVGVYAAAARISEVWYLALAAVITGVVPRLAELHSQDGARYAERLADVMRWLVWMSIGVAAVFTLASSWIVGLLYGAAFADAAGVLAIHVWAGVPVALGFAASAWFVNEGLTKYGLYQALAGAAASVALNVMLIPALGLKGAAVSVLLSQVVSAVLMNAMVAKTRPLFRMQMKALFFR